MFRLFITAILISLISAPAWADWRVRTSGTTAGIWIRNEDGTSLALNCEGAAADMLRLDLTIETTDIPLEGEGIAEFVIGNFSVEMPTEPFGIGGQRLQILRITADYNAPEIVEFRAAIARGNAVSLPAQPDFQAVSFPLRGSGRAISELEEACPGFWERG